MVFVLPCMFFPALPFPVLFCTTATPSVLFYTTATTIVAIPITTGRCCRNRFIASIATATTAITTTKNWSRFVAGK